MQALGFLNEGEIVRSHLAARLNGYIAGRGDVSQFDAEVSHLGLSEETADYVRQLVVKYEGHGQSS
jgi:peptide-methionine (S)-S-oxide reductase